MVLYGVLHGLDETPFSTRQPLRVSLLFSAHFVMLKKRAAVWCVSVEIRLHFLIWNHSDFSPLLPLYPLCSPAVTSVLFLASILLLSFSLSSPPPSLSVLLSACYRLPLSVGQEVQRVSVISNLPNLVRQNPAETFRRVVPKVRVTNLSRTAHQRTAGCGQ